MAEETLDELSQELRKRIMNWFKEEAHKQGKTEEEIALPGYKHLFLDAEKFATDFVKKSDEFLKSIPDKKPEISDADLEFWEQTH